MPNLALAEDEQIKQDLDMLQRKAIAAAEATRKKADEDAKATLARVQEEAKALRSEAISAASAANAMRAIAEEEAKSIVARALEETKKMHADAAAALLLSPADAGGSPQQKKTGLKLLSFKSSSKATFAKVHPAPSLNAAIVPSGIRAEPPSPSPVSKSNISSTSSTESNSLPLEDTSNAPPIGSQTAEDLDILVSAKEEADNIIVQARAEAARVQHEADVHASSVLRKAFGEVELMIERAHERASEIVNKAESKMREKNESLASMEQDVAKEVKARLDRADADVARLIANAKSNAADILKVARIQAESLINGSDNNKETLLLSSMR